MSLDLGSTHALLGRLELTPKADAHPDGGLKISLSTHALADWSFRRSKVPADALWLGFGVSLLLGWKIQLSPREPIYRTEWTQNGLSVDTQQLRSRLLEWPALDDPFAFPQLAAALERLLDVRFVREAQLTVDTLTLDGLLALRRWLLPAADKLIVFAGCLDDSIPAPDEWRESDRRGSFSVLCDGDLHLDFDPT